MQEQKQAMPIAKRVGFFGQLWQFLRVRKKWWLAPIIIVILLFAILMIFAQATPLAPFIYTIF